ncbi:MAG TPA: hypothetical protein VGS22_30045 [Thermoanaerobaculia bacterium]|nr:hypothetical protein [Thermoanaerobaculia bacterium]
MNPSTHLVCDSLKASDSEDRFAIQLKTPWAVEGVKRRDYMNGESRQGVQSEWGGDFRFEPRPYNDRRHFRRSEIRMFDSQPIAAR